MDNNKETILTFIKSLRNEIKLRDNKISQLEKENKYLKDIINNDSDCKKYKRIIMILCVLLMISSGICIYHLLM